LDVSDRIDGPDALEDATESVGRQATADVTRYLAAAAYLDETFRADVVAQTLQQKFRFIAPSYGVNISCVVRHCIASRRLSRRRDVILSALVFVGLWALHLSLVFTLAIFVGGLLVAIALTSPKTKLRWRIFLSIVAYIAITAFALHPLSLLTALAALFVVAADTYTRRYRVAARRMNGKDFKAHLPPYGREHSHQQASDERRVAHLVGHHDGNVVVYSGFSPFKGSGIELMSWRSSLAIDVTRARDGSHEADSPGPIDTADVYAHVIEAMNGLGLKGCSAADRFYVSGGHVGGDKQLYFYPKAPHDRFPRLRSSIDEVAKLEAKPPEAVRRYADIKVVSWDSQLILSAFVRFSRPSHYLFVEWSYFLLPPLKPHYFDINRLNPRATPHEWFCLVVDSTKTMPLLWLEAPLRVAKWMGTPISRARREYRVEQAIRENPTFDYGALGSIRESGSNRVYGKYFQQRDIEGFHKIVHRNLLESISEFLKERGVDTSDLDLVRVNVNLLSTVGNLMGTNLQVGNDRAMNI